MSIGTGIVLFVIGAVLTFALKVQVAWVDLHMVGYIFMIAGVVIFLIGIVLLARRRRIDSVNRTAVDPATGERVTRRSTAAPDDEVGL